MVAMTFPQHIPRILFGDQHTTIILTVRWTKIPLVVTYDPENTTIKDPKKINKLKTLNRIGWTKDYFDLNKLQNILKKKKAETTTLYSFQDGTEVRYRVRGSTDIQKGMTRFVTTDGKKANTDVMFVERLSDSARIELSNIWDLTPLDK